MRGKPPLQKLILRLSRITPADAGKTKTNQRTANHDEDHPRGCGENCLKKSESRKKTGSPPRMRGKPPADAEVVSASGITPADAGKTIYSKKSFSSATDHPRGCGENLYSSVQTPVLPGSPPRMRGKLSRTPKHSRDPGITPADAGKTLLLKLYAQS